jgi:Flp pilus assembly protein TadG
MLAADQESAMIPHSSILTRAPGRARARRARQGNMALVTAVSFVVLCGFAALVVDLGYTRMVRAQLQASTDSAALGAAQLLDGTDAGLTRAHDAGAALAGMNKADGRVVSIGANAANAPTGDVVVGFYDEADGSFTPTHDESIANAVQVRAARTDLSPLFSAIAFQKDELQAGACTVGVQQPPTGASKVPWYLPFALPECIFDQYSDAQLKTQAFKLNPAGIDNTGWARVGGSLNASWAKSHLSDIKPCMNTWATGAKVESACAEAAIGDTLYLGNGVVQSALSDLNSQIQTSIAWKTDLWDAMPARQATSSIPAGKYGKVYAGPVPIFDGGSGYCSASASWNGSKTITGFAWGVIYDVQSTGSAASRTLWMRVDPDDLYNVGTAWGGPNHSVTVLPPAKIVECAE